RLVDALDLSSKVVAVQGNVLQFPLHRSLPWVQRAGIESGDNTRRADTARLRGAAVVRNDRPVAPIERSEDALNVAARVGVIADDDVAVVDAEHGEIRAARRHIGRNPGAGSKC